jgi:predicted cytidylate kinase
MNHKKQPLNYKIPNLIIISGQIASGTSTTTELLAEKLDYKYLDIGKLFRKMAKKRNKNIITYQKIAAKEPQIDKKIDYNTTIEFIKKNKKAVITGKCTPWILEKLNIRSYKIFLKAPEKIRAQRLAKRENIPLQEAFFELIQREKLHSQRWQKEYNIDRKDLSIYDLIINTTNLSPQQVIDKILAKLREKS